MVIVVVDVVLAVVVVDVVWLLCGMGVYDLGNGK